MADIYLFRHAHVDYAPPNRITEHNPLTPLGHRMAEQLAERCDAWDLQYLFVSPMLRAQQTADAISERFPDLPREVLPEFAESSIDDMVDFRGTPPSDDMREWTAERYAHANVRLLERVMVGFEKVQGTIAAHGLERVAIVCHGGPINFLLRYFLGEVDLDAVRTWFYLDWATTCCLRIEEERRWVLWVNDARHIDNLRHLLPEEG
jgi:broad specificity phosphatase PhoE